MPMHNTNGHEESLRGMILSLALKIAVFTIALWLIFTFVFGIGRVSGESMYPKLMDGDLTLYYRMETNYQVGDVVVFHAGGTSYYARIAAQGGDVVDFDETGQLIVNGNVQQEELFCKVELLGSVLDYPYTVEEGSYFLLCDYRPSALDSRSYGTISKGMIDGKLITILRRRQL